METITFTVPVRYMEDGWCVHSGAGRNHDRWWLVLYRGREQVTLYPTTYAYGNHAAARAKARALNSKGWTTS